MDAEMVLYVANCCYEFLFYNSHILKMSRIITSFRIRLSSNLSINDTFEELAIKSPNSRSWWPWCGGIFILNYFVEITWKLLLRSLFQNFLNSKTRQTHTEPCFTKKILVHVRRRHDGQDPPERLKSMVKFIFDTLSFFRDLLVKSTVR